MSQKKDMLTIKELADSLNMPKNKISYQASKLNSNYIVKLNGIKHLTKDAQTLIIKELSTDNLSNLNTKLDSDLDTSKHFIKHLESQLDSKDSQIKNLQTLLDQQQQLTLQSNKQIDKLQLQLESKEHTSTDEPDLDSSMFKESIEEQQQRLKQELVLSQSENESLKEQVAELNQLPKKSFWKRLFN